MTKNRTLIFALCILAIAFLAFFLQKIFSGQTILPQALHLGPLTIRYYSLFLAAAILAGYEWARIRAAHFNISAAELERTFLLLIVCGFVGARLYHVISEIDVYAQNLGQIFFVWQGGLSIFGALIGGIIGLGIAQRFWQKHHSLLTLLDWLVPSLLIGQVIGRLGNLFNYEIFGYPTTLPWKMFVPETFRPVEFMAQSFFHPLFLYEMILNGAILIILLKFIKPKWRVGSLFFTYLFLYNGGRIFLEFLRIDSVFWGAVRLNSLVSAVFALIGLIGLYYIYHASTSSSHN